MSPQPWEWEKLIFWILITWLSHIELFNGNLLLTYGVSQNLRTLCPLTRTHNCFLQWLISFFFKEFLWVYLSLLDDMCWGARSHMLQQWVISVHSSIIFYPYSHPLGCEWGVSSFCRSFPSNQKCGKCYQFLWKQAETERDTETAWAALFSFRPMSLAKTKQKDPLDVSSERSGVVSA